MSDGSPEDFSVEEQWATRDLPVLRAMVVLRERKPLGAVHIAEVFEELGGRFDADALQRAAVNLQRGGYVELIGTFQQRFTHVREVSDRALRAVGMWPSAEGVDALLETLQRAEESATDPEDRSRLSKARQYLGGVSRDLLVDISAALVARQFGA